VSSWKPADSVMLTAFWSFSSVVVAVAVICEGFLRFCLVYYCVELVCVFSCFAVCVLGTVSRPFYLDPNRRFLLCVSALRPSRPPSLYDTTRIQICTENHRFTFSGNC
jgi:hypothetical protein